MATNCVFCNIITGREPAKILDEDRGHIVIEPIGPHAPGHVLFISKRHLPDATTSPLGAGLLMEEAAKYLHGREGNILTSVGPAATQTVRHLHIHVVPRSAEDGLPRDWPWMREGF